jgi:hypothetical protein
VDIYTFELEAALAQAGCPLCRVDDIDQRRWMQTFIREGHHDAGVIRRFLASGGFCPSHAELFSAMALERDAVVVVGIVYRTLVHEDLHRLGSLRADTYRRRRRRRRRHRGVCPACSERERSAENKSYFFCDALADGAFRRRYATSGGLCARHFVTVLEQAAERKLPAYEFLLDDWITRLASLQAGLAEYHSKRDYRYAQEPRGEEQQAPIAALRHYAGMTTTATSPL